MKLKATNREPGEQKGNKGRDFIKHNLIEVACFGCGNFIMRAKNVKNPKCLDCKKIKQRSYGRDYMEKHYSKREKIVKFKTGLIKKIGKVPSFI